MQAQQVLPISGSTYKHKHLDFETARLITSDIYIQDFWKSTWRQFSNYNIF